MTLQHADNANGFSMVEMLVVLAIIGLAAAIALPSLTSLKSQTPQRLATTAAQFAQIARLRAISTGIPTAVIVDISKNKLSVEPGHEMIELPHNITITAVVGRDLQTTAERGSIVFLPNGGATGGHVAFSEASGLATKLHIHWLTGAITVVIDAH